MYQSWENLLFLHWTVDPGIIQQTLPPGLTVDTFSGRAWLGIVPFFMRGIRPRFCPPVPGLSNFLEINLRTYVYDREGQPGVWFYSLDADQWIAVKIARGGFSLPYVYSDISARHSKGDWIQLDLKRKGHDCLSYRYRKASALGTAKPGSLEFFLLERYHLFAYNSRNHRLSRGRIHHSPYQLARPEIAGESAQLLPLNGFEDPGRPSEHALMADRVDVTVYGMETVAG